MTLCTPMLQGEEPVEVSAEFIDNTCIAIYVGREPLAYVQVQDEERLTLDLARNKGLNRWFELDTNDCVVTRISD